MTFYHVERSLKLKSEQTVFPYSITGTPFEKFIFELYDNKLSYHGAQYLLPYKHSVDMVSLRFLTESVFETIRLGFYPEKPSRFQSFFAFESLQDGLSFFGNGFPVYEVESDIFHKGDMQLLNCSCLIHAYENAHLYWSGKHSPNPLYEYLLPLPVTLGERVHDPVPVAF